LGLACFLQKQIKMEWPRSESSGVCSFTDAELDFLTGIWAAEFLVNDSNVTVQKRMWPRIASSFDVFWDEKFAVGESNSCRVFFSFPKRASGFMTINYFRTGPNTEYRIIARAATMVEQIAISRGCQGIVCQVISRRISTRLLLRWGYVPHAKSLGNGHFIRRLKC
jgi:hypothetical protein